VITDLAAVINKFGFKTQAISCITDKERLSGPGVHFNKPVRLKWTFQSFDQFQYNFQTSVHLSYLPLLDNR